MPIGPEMRRLRAEHAALATLSQLLVGLIRAPEAPRPTELASVRGMLRETLLRHLKCEDWILYPRLKASGNPEVVALAGEFVREMGHIAQDFATYDANWTAERIAEDWSGFCRETEVVLNVLGMRIERENCDLYPAAEQLDFL
ncbi:MAG: hemerythrin domain-containing protein [Alphaproteobacteria bacterium]|nr:hemerythrin domain-containing protein [Alphaproteobacteria bacterium]MBU0863911.1 hemerythrin domain-containing protein [Alphaproteobacteria bacterium]MBU1824062.1 hemerythrin domain-containing protein [Alphaproteobacteria bacterium]